MCKELHRGDTGHTAATLTNHPADATLGQAVLSNAGELN